MLKTIEHGQTQERAEGPQRKRMAKKSNVKRETQVLKAIINQTRSIGNEFLVINIKADTEAGWRRARVVGLPVSRLQDTKLSTSA